VADIVEVLRDAVIERRRAAIEGAETATEVAEAVPRAMTAGSFESQPVGGVAGAPGPAARLVADAIVEAPIDGPDSMPLSISVEHAEPSPHAPPRARAPSSSPPPSKPAKAAAPPPSAATVPPRAPLTHRAPPRVV